MRWLPGTRGLRLLFLPGSMDQLYRSRPGFQDRWYIGGMVSAHGRGRVSDANAFDSGLIGRCPALDGGTRDAVDLPVAPFLNSGYVPKCLCPFHGSMNRTLAVAKLDHASFHRHAQGHAGLNSIQTIFVA